MTDAEWQSVFIEVRRQIREQTPGMDEQSVFARAVDWMRDHGHGIAPDDVPTVVKLIPILAAAGATLGMVGPIASCVGSPKVVEFRKALAALYKAANVAGVAPDLGEMLGNVAQEIGMEWLKTILKGLKGAGAAIGGVILTVVTDAILNALGAVEISNAIKTLPVVGTLVSGVYAGLILAAQNWWKHRNDPKP
jgi:hypothetical protein